MKAWLVDPGVLGALASDDGQVVGFREHLIRREGEARRWHVPARGMTSLSGSRAGPLVSGLELFEAGSLCPGRWRGAAEERGGREDREGRRRAAYARNAQSLFPTKFIGVASAMASAWAGTS